MQMSAKQSRSEARQSRKESKKTNHKPLLDLVAQEQIRRPNNRRTIEIKPLNESQRLYDQAIQTSIITFGIGPAGTGKTWWAAMRAAEKLKAGEINKIIVTRPAVEAGENMGFLPGNLDEKYEPYFRPVKDAFEEAFGSGHLEYLIKAKIIEPRPLAFLRGSTIKDAWLIADEMQNATATQMKLLLTRAGHNSKFIINGDPRQCDLKGQTSGLIDAVKRLRRVPSIRVVEFTKEDIVRSGIVQDIVEAYEDPNEESYNESHQEERNSEGLRWLLRR
jgi:phosphate starvation-inducible protein PhoH and related proteins